MKDEQKSKALQVCRMLLDRYDRARREGVLALKDLDQAVNIARTVVVRRGALSSSAMKKLGD